MQKRCAVSQQRTLLLFLFVFSALRVAFSVQIDQRAKGHSTEQADFPAPGESLVPVAELHLMLSLGQHHTHHYIAGEHHFRILTVHFHSPVSILGNGSVEQAIPVTVDGAFHPCVAKFGQFQSGCTQDLVDLGQPFHIQNGRTDVNGAGFVGILAGGSDLHHITGYHIAHGHHLLQAHVFGIYRFAVFPDGHVISLGEIQLHAHEAVRCHRIGVGDGRTL